MTGSLMKELFNMTVFPDGVIEDWGLLLPGSYEALFEHLPLFLVVCL